jgi:hypothetical protein
VRYRITDPKVLKWIVTLQAIADPKNNAPNGERASATIKAKELILKYGVPVILAREQPAGHEPEPQPQVYTPEPESDAEAYYSWYDDYDAWAYNRPRRKRRCTKCGEKKDGSDFVWGGNWCWECRHPATRWL